MAKILADVGRPESPLTWLNKTSVKQLPTLIGECQVALTNEAIELIQRHSGPTAIMDSEPIHRSWRDARVATMHGALNVEVLAENHGRLVAAMQPPWEEHLGHVHVHEYAPGRREVQLPRLGLVLHCEHPHRAVAHSSSQIFCCRRVTARA